MKTRRIRQNVCKGILASICVRSLICLTGTPYSVNRILHESAVPALEDSGSRISEEELDVLISDYYRPRSWKPAAGCKAASDRPVLKSTIFYYC